MKKVYNIIILIALMAGIVMGGYFLFGKNKDVAPQAALYFSSGGEFKQGEATKVFIFLDSGKTPIDGVDISFSYEPQKASIEKDSFKNESSKFASIFGPKIENGVVKLSALTKRGENFAGEEAISSFSLTPLLAEDSFLTPVFEKGRTNDSNVSLAEKDADILKNFPAFSIVIGK